MEVEVEVGDGQWPSSVASDDGKPGVPRKSGAGKVIYDGVPMD